ncbi:MAG: response regulator, partial [bacterium]|nr:response regulator [bacterium]
MKETILLIEDEESQQTVLAGFLLKKGFRVELASNAEEGVSIFEKQQVDLVLTDYRMPGGTGLDVLHAVRKIDPNVPLILITAYGSIEGAVEAMRDGAFDYI